MGKCDNRYEAPYRGFDSYPGDLDGAHHEARLRTRDALGMRRQDVAPQPPPLAAVHIPILALAQTDAPTLAVGAARCCTADEVPHTDRAGPRKAVRHAS